MKAIFLVFINPQRNVFKSVLSPNDLIYFLQISNSLYMLLKTAVFVMMKCLLRKIDQLLIFCRASLIKNKKRRFSALDYKIILKNQNF
jgi:hypothetical protein